MAREGAKCFETTETDGEEGAVAEGAENHSNDPVHFCLFNDCGTLCWEDVCFVGIGEECVKERIRERIKWGE